MIATRYTLLGGEGCPALAITNPAENRNICGVGLAATCRFEQNGAGTYRLWRPIFDTRNGIFVREMFA